MTEAEAVRHSVQVDVGGARVGFEKGSGADAWRVLVNDRPVPMTLEETESTTTNTGSRERVVRRARPVAWAPLGQVLDGHEPFAVAREGAGHRVSCHVVVAQGAVYNTGVYVMRSVVMRFPADRSSVSLTVDEHADTSS